MKYLTVNCSISSDTTEGNFSTVLKHLTTGEQIGIMSQRTITLTAGTPVVVNLDGITKLKLLAWNSALSSITYSIDGGVVYNSPASNTGLLYISSAVNVLSLTILSLTAGEVNIVYAGDKV